MRAESLYGWLVAPDPAVRTVLEAELEHVYRARGPEPGLPGDEVSFAALESELLVERYVRNARPLYTRLPFDYRRVPSRVRSAGLAVLDRLHASGEGEFPRWPSEERLDDLRASIWSDAAERIGLRLESPTYPGNRSGAVLLTHDIDSRGEISGIADLRELERGVGLPSSFGFIPRVSWPDRSVIEGLVADGCEVYCHDEYHDGKLPYKGTDAMRAAFERLFDENPYARPLVRGFRSGQLLTSSGLLGVLKDWFAFDLSIPDSERGGPYGATAGCASVYPFMVDGLLEIPLTLPQDFYLAHVERFTGARMQSVWRDKLARVLSRGGVAVVNCHPVWTTPRHPDVWAAYEGLLEAIADCNAWITTPSALHDWIIQRG